MTELQPLTVAALDAKTLHANRRRAIWRWVIVAITFSIVWSITAALILNEKSRTRAAALAELDTLAASVAMHAESVFADAGKIAAFLRVQYLISPQNLALQKWNEKYFLNSTYYSQVGVIDAKGMYVASNLADFRPIDLSDRPHFRYHIDATTDVPYVSESLIGRASGRPSIQLSRRITDSRGRFRGVTVVSVSPLYFVERYNDLLKDNGFIGLLGQDGKSRIVKTRAGFTVGEKLDRNAWFANEVLPRNAGNTTVHDWPVPSSQMMAYRKVEGWPLIAIVGIEENEAMAPYYRSRNAYLLGACLLTLAIAVTVISQVRSNRRLIKSNQVLRRSALELQKANRTKDRFVAHISHELRTPIAGIMSGAQLLELSLDDPELLRDANAIHRASEHLLEVVNNLLAVSRGQAEGFRVRVEKIAINPLLEEICQAWPSTCSAKGLAFAFETELPADARILGDRTALRQIMQNLLSNAVKYTSEGKVIVTALIQGGQVHIAVKDSGPGIPPELMSGLFQQFSTLDRWETREQHGTGLGLYLSQELAQAMNSRIKVTSVQGSGATFSFDLAMAPPDALEAA